MEAKEPHINPEWKKPLVVSNRTFKAFYDFSLTSADLEKAREELGETDDVRNTCVRKLKEKIENDKELRFRTDDSSLLRYLRYSKFDCEKTYVKLRNFCLFRKEHPELFTIPSNFEFLMKTLYGRWLRYANEEGALIGIVDFRKWNIEEVSVWEYVQMHHAMADIISLNPNIQINGVLGIWDFRGVGLKHVPIVLNFKVLSFVLKALQDMYPFRMKRVIVIYSNRLMQAIYNNLIRYLLKKKIRDRVIIIGSDISELHQYVDPAVLPKEYGGNLEDSECCIIQPILDNIDFLNYERSFTNSLRPS